MLDVCDITDGGLRNWQVLKNQFPALSVSDYFRLGDIYNAFPAEWKNKLRFQGRNDTPVSLPDETVRELGH